MAVANAVLLVRLLRFHSSLAALNAFQQSNVAFDEFMEVQAWGGLMFTVVISIDFGVLVVSCEF